MKADEVSEFDWSSDVCYTDLDAGDQRQERVICNLKDNKKQNDKPKCQKISN